MNPTVTYPIPEPTPDQDMSQYGNCTLKKKNQCPYCQKELANPSYIKQHVKSVHEKLKPFQCDQCFAKFAVQFSLHRHMAKVHQSKKSKGMEVCQNNDIYFSQAVHNQNNGTKHKSVLVNQINHSEVFVNPTSQPQFLVQQVYKTVNLLMLPVTKLMRQIDRNVKNLLPCHQCSMKFGTSYHLKAHVDSVHKKLRPYQCEQCITKFGQRGNLQRHIATVHQNNLSINCSLCHYKFSIMSDLKRHVKYVHERCRPFQCERCQSKFRSNGDLKRHVSYVHDKIRPFKCNWCAAGFVDNFSLTSHANEMKNSLQQQLEEEVLDLSTSMEQHPKGYEKQNVTFAIPGLLTPAQRM